MYKKQDFENRELELLRNAVDTAQKISGKRLVQNDNVQNIIHILENFLRSHKTICYGGTAVNNILPEQERFYNKNIEIPDYDFFSPYAMEYSKKLADIYYKAGYTEVEAKSGVHSGTYKVFVNFLPIADITYLENNIFNNLVRNSIKINAINYCPPNYLRMAMYQELSRPMGDVTRWEKVLKRIILLNKNYPLRGIACNRQDFLRKYEGTLAERNKVYNIARESFINQGLVFFGGYAASLYGKYMNRHEKTQIDTIPDFDILSEDPLTSATILKEQLNYEGIKNVKIIKRKNIGEYIDIHYQVQVGKDIICFIYKTTACHSYNIINIDGRKVKIATIDTMLSFYLIFLYANRPYYDENRILCMSEYLFKVQLRNRLQQKGLLKRFTPTCIGYQKTLEDIKMHKGKILERLKQGKITKSNKEYKENFFRYIPDSNNRDNNIVKSKYKTKAKTKTRDKAKKNAKTRRSTR